VCVCMHVYLWTIYSCSLLRSVQALQDDVRIQDGEEIAACVEDSLALLCKMLPEKAETFMFNRLDYCAQVNFDLRSFGFLSDFSCNIQPFNLFLRSSFSRYFRFCFRLCLFNQFRSRMGAEFLFFTVV